MKLESISVAGKDDFGRTKNKLITKDIEKEKIKEEEKIKPAVGVKKQA